VCVSMCLFVYVRACVRACMRACVLTECMSVRICVDVCVRVRVCVYSYYVRVRARGSRCYVLNVVKILAARVQQVQQPQLLPTAHRLGILGVLEFGLLVQLGGKAQSYLTYLAPSGGQSICFHG